MINLEKMVLLGGYNQSIKGYHKIKSWEPLFYCTLSD